MMWHYKIQIYYKISKYHELLRTTTRRILEGIGPGTIQDTITAFTWCDQQIPEKICQNGRHREKNPASTNYMAKTLTTSIMSINVANFRQVFVVI